VQAFVDVVRLKYQLLARPEQPLLHS